MLSRALAMEEIAAHTPAELNWDCLPSSVIVQMHWRCSQEFEQLLLQHNMQPICIIRHPLDVLISILHFCAFEPDTHRWLAGVGGNESTIVHATPVDSAFLDY